MIPSLIRLALCAAAIAAVLGANVGATAAPAEGRWLGEELPLPLAVRTAQDLAVKAAAEKQYLIFNLLAGGKLAWDGGDYPTAAAKWEALLKVHRERGVAKQRHPDIRADHDQPGYHQDRKERWPWPLTGLRHRVGTGLRLDSFARHHISSDLGFLGMNRAALPAEPGPKHAVGRLCPEAEPRSGGQSGLCAGAQRLPGTFSLTGAGVTQAN